MRKKVLVLLIVILITLIGIFAWWMIPTKISDTNVGGIMYKNQIWSGEILVTEQVVVPYFVTLKIEPGTKVKFMHYRGYKEPGKKVGLDIYHGTLKAIGTKDKQIWFTSDASFPINGDWLGIYITNSYKSKLDHVIVEFGEMGIMQFDSSVPVTNSIVRWVNAEGLYAERSHPIFINNTLYGNGYHEIALEQYNKDVIIKNNIFRDGHVALHHEMSSSDIEGNYFKNYPDFAISAGMNSDIIVKGNKFEDIKGQPLNIYDSKADIKDNDFGNDSNTNVPIPEFDYKDLKGVELGYIPGEENDKYMYVYPDDETRKTIKKIGKDLYFGWALLYARDSLWRFSLGAGEIGKGLDFIKVNPETGSYEKFGTNEIMNPRGLAHDGEYFYVNDFSLLRIFKFKLEEGAKEGDFIEVVDSFDIPEKENGGVMGLTSDNEFLYLKSRDGSKMYKMDKNGKLIGEIKFENPVAMQSLVWTGEYFWTSGGCNKGLCKFDVEGKLVGEIYPPAKDTWALAYDGKYLWALMRTSEMWNDPKIYQIEILDDSLG